MKRRKRSYAALMNGRVITQFRSAWTNREIWESTDGIGHCFFFSCPGVINEAWGVLGLLLRGALYIASSSLYQLLLPPKLITGIASIQRPDADIILRCDISPPSIFMLILNCHLSPRTTTIHNVIRCLSVHLLQGEAYGQTRGLDQRRGREATGRLPRHQTSERLPELSMGPYGGRSKHDCLGNPYVYLSALI